MAIINNSIVVLPALERVANSTSGIRTTLSNSSARSTNLLVRLVDRLDTIVTNNDTLGSGAMLDNLGSGAVRDNLGSGVGLDGLGPGVVRENLGNGATAVLEGLGNLGSGAVRDNLVSGLARENGITQVWRSTRSNESKAEALVVDTFGLAPGQETDRFIGALLGLVNSTSSNMPDAMVKSPLAVQAQSAGALAGRSGSDSGLIASITDMWNGLRGTSAILDSVKELVQGYSNALTGAGRKLSGVQTDLLTGAVSTTGGLVANAISQVRSDLSDKALAVIKAEMAVIEFEADLPDKALAVIKAEMAFRADLSDKALAVIKAEMAVIESARAELKNIGQGLVGRVGERAAAEMAVIESARAELKNIGQGFVGRVGERAAAEMAVIESARAELKNIGQGFVGKIGSLMGVYETQVQAASDILRSSTDSVTDQIGNPPEISLRGVWSSVGDNTLSGASLSNLYESFGLNARGTKVMELLGNANTFSDLYSKLFGDS
eukprot:gene29967-18033_t